MDPSDVHPDLLGEALSQSGQRLAQMASLLTSWAMVEARRRERHNAALAARSEQEQRELHAQEQAARQLARAGWAPAADRRWLNEAGLIDAARAWSAAAAYADADADPEAATALARCEDRLRHLHPYAMSWYDRQRAQGASLFDAMGDALPLFDRAPHVRPGGPGAERPALEVGTDAETATGSAWQWGQSWEASVTSSAGGDHRAAGDAGRGAADLAAENFPWTAADGVRASASSPQQATPRPQRVSPVPVPRRNPAR